MQGRENEFRPDNREYSITGMKDRDGRNDFHIVNNSDSDEVERNFLRELCRDFRHRINLSVALSPPIVDVIIENIVDDAASPVHNFGLRIRSDGRFQQQYALAREDGARCARRIAMLSRFFTRIVIAFVLFLLQEIVLSLRRHSREALQRSPVQRE